MQHQSHPLEDDLDDTPGNYIWPDEATTSESQSLDKLPLPGQAFLANLLRLRLLSSSIADQFLQTNSPRLPELNSAEVFGDALIQANLLTQYQLDRILAGTTHGLVLGQYRVLERLGAGGMGVVFLGEHMMLHRKVAIKVMPVDDECSPGLIQRFSLEMRVLAQLHHPNIVMAFDAGRASPQPGFPRLLYLVMELVDGCDLEHHVLEHGQVAIGKACRWIHQAACGLQEAHAHNLVHRDIKPSNILLTQDERVKIVDFGLVRQFSSTITDPRTTLGTLDFMPPEQSIDPSSVGSHADIYSLGATLFWVLTGQAPYPATRSLAAALRQMQQEIPRRLRTLRQDVPEELDALLARILDRDPTRRPPMALSVMKSLEPFATQE